MAGMIFVTSILGILKMPKNKVHLAPSLIAMLLAMYILLGNQYSYAETVEVEIKADQEDPKGNIFHPQEITISVGTTVVWTNTDTVEHTVLSGKHDKLWVGKFFSSDFIQPGDKFEHTFDTPGVFLYFDVDYPWEPGKVIVEGEIESSIALLSMSGDIITSSLPGQRIIIQPLMPHFAPDSTLTVSLDDRTIETAPPEVVVDEDSFFSMSVILPLDIAVGEHTLTVKDSVGNIASETFTIGCIGPEQEIPSSSGVFPVEYQGKKFYIEYSVKNVKITDIEAYESSLIASVITSATDNGMLEIAVPRELVDATIGGMEDDVFIVLVNGIDFMYEETHTTETKRTVKITVPTCAEQIEIIGTVPLSPWQVIQWKTYELAHDGKVFRIPYKIINGEVNKIEKNPEDGFVLISLGADAQKDGLITISIPRNLADPKTNEKDDAFMVLVDGNEPAYEEVNNSNCFRTLSVPFVAGSEEIEIIALVKFPVTPDMTGVTSVAPVYVNTDKTHFEAGETITISGCTNLALHDKELTLDIIDPEGEVFKTLSLIPNPDGTFSTSLAIEDEHAINGTYIVKATYAGKSATNAFVIPEFPISLIALATSLTGFIIVRYVFRWFN